MRFAYQPSLLQSTRRLSPRASQRLLKAVGKFQRAMEGGEWPRGLGITHLRGEYFEFRVDLHTRVVYRRTTGMVCYVLYGSHDDIRRFLKSA